MERDCYLCVHCTQQGRITEATEVDHIIPVAKGGTDTEDNLQSLCRDHHEAKTLADCGRKAPRAVGPDGYPTE